jgi:hypothetical protein
VGERSACSEVAREPDPEGLPDERELQPVRNSSMIAHRPQPGHPTLAGRRGG